MTAPEINRLPFDEVCRRAGGRRRWNALRRRRAERRAALIVAVQTRYYLSPVLPLPSGLMARLAREFGVSRSTVCRDFQAFRRAAPYGRRLPSMKRLTEA